jgi:hypothetical protein
MAKIRPIPAGMLKSNKSLQQCCCCSRWTKAPVCQRCLAQLPLAQAWILETVRGHEAGLSLSQVLRSMRRLGISELVIQVAWLVLQINGRIEAKA